MYPIGSEMMTSTFSGNSISSILPATTNTLSPKLLASTKVYK